MNDFDAVMQKFRTGELNINDWNFATHCEKKGESYAAYIMGEGAEQCLAHKGGFKSREEIIDLFKSIGVKYVLPGVG